VKRMRQHGAGHKAQGRELLAANRPEDAVREFDLAIELMPNDHEAIYLKGLANLRLGHMPMALLCIDRALELSPDTTLYLTDRAVAKLRVGDKEGARADMDRCISIAPTNAYHWSLRGFMRNAAGDPAGALEDYREAVRLDPDDAITYNNMGLVEEGMGYTKEAKESYSRSDMLAGITPKAPEHMVPLKDERPQPAPTATVPKAPSARDLMRVMWRTFTDAEERKDFFDFLRRRNGAA
jgi:Flp pilus assembly protein TadD